MCNISGVAFCTQSIDYTWITAALHRGVTFAKFREFSPAPGGEPHRGVTLRVAGRKRRALCKRRRATPPREGEREIEREIDMERGRERWREREREREREMERENKAPQGGAAERGGGARERHMRGECECCIHGVCVFFVASCVWVRARSCARAGWCIRARVCARGMDRIGAGGE